MEYSMLFKHLIAKAETVHKEENTQTVSAVCFLIAVCELCMTEYRGLTDYDKHQYPELFEEERLRYIFERSIRSSPSLARMHFKLKKRQLLGRYDTGFLDTYSLELESVAKARGKMAISADVAFLVALLSLSPSDRLATSICCDDFEPVELLSSVDKMIFGYVIGKLNEVNERLINKAKLAEKEQNWRPALKVCEPEELRQRLFGFVKSESAGKTLELIIPQFFGREDEDLKLTVVRYNKCYYVHDNEGALRSLRRKTSSSDEYMRIFGQIEDNISTEGYRTVGGFCDPRGLLHFLQILILISNANLYYSQMSEVGLDIDADIEFPSEEQFEPFDFGELLNALKEMVYCSYDQNCGTKLTFGTHYALNEENISFLIEAFDDKSVRISDANKGEVGGIFESFYFGNDDIAQYSEFINKVCDGFGVCFDGKDLYLPINSNDLQDVFRGLLRFTNVAVVLSEFGRMIDPK